MWEPRGLRLGEMEGGSSLGGPVIFVMPISGFHIDLDQLWLMYVDLVDHFQKYLITRHG